MTQTRTPYSSSHVASLDEAKAFFAANPDIDAIDMIFTNLSGVPRGKRLRHQRAYRWRNQKPKYTALLKPTNTG